METVKLALTTCFPGISCLLALSVEILELQQELLCSELRHS